jgi:hypothetical protein
VELKRDGWLAAAGVADRIRSAAGAGRLPKI